jgi:deoxyribodipyrimidine photo-lyase
MRELLHTGWMTKRGRQNVASFLVHELRLPWIWGGSWFEKMLVDYDPELCWGNWLYLSGRGSDPTARKLSVPDQTKLYDPTGEYRGRWL